MKDSKGKLWFSTEAAAFSYNKKSDYFNEYFFAKKDDKLLGLTAEPVLEKGNSIWFANNGYGIIKFDTATKQNISYPLADDSGNLIYFHTAGVYDKKNSLWFASIKGLFAFNIRKKMGAVYIRKAAL